MPIETRTVRVYNPAACTQAIYGCMATDAINYNPQATINGGCEWGSEARGPENFTRQCSAGTGTVVAFTAPDDWRISTVSKADANVKRDADFTAAGQANAQTLGNCLGDYLKFSFTDAGNGSFVNWQAQLLRMGYPPQQYNTFTSHQAESTSGAGSVTIQGDGGVQVEIDGVKGALQLMPIQQGLQEQKNYIFYISAL